MTRSPRMRRASKLPSAGRAGGQLSSDGPRPRENEFATDSPLERAGFEPSVPGESGFDFAREVRGRLFAGGRWIRTLGPPWGRRMYGTRSDLSRIRTPGDR